MTDDKQPDEHEDEKPEAGFDLKIPGFHAWGGEKQLAMIMPVIKWGLIAIFAFWGLSELKGLWK